MRYLLLTIFVCMKIFAVDAVLKIEKDVDQRANIAVVDASDSFDTDSRKIFDIFIADFRLSAHFKVSRDYLEDSFSRSLGPDLRKYDYVLKYLYSENEAGAELKVRLFRGGNSSMVFESRYHIALTSKYPFLVHKAVSEINDALGYKSVSWLNRHVVLSRYTGRKRSEIVLADCTFHYKKAIIKGGLSIFPKWGESRQTTLYYTDYNGELPILYRLDLRTGKRVKLLDSQGMLVCSDVSDDGKRVLLTMAPDGQPDIYEYDTLSRNLKRITFFSGIDVNGKYADDGKSVVFVSNRMGYPNIYIKSLEGNDVRQLVFFGKNNNSCDTYGNRIVFSSKEDMKNYNLFIINSDGSAPRPITAGGINQFPRFSPNGDIVQYIKRDTGGNAIGYIGLTTGQSLLFPMGVERIQSIDW